MKKIIKIFELFAFLFISAAVFAATPYEHCRCNQATPGLTNNATTCCLDTATPANAYQNANKSTCCMTVSGGKMWTGGNADFSPSYCKYACPASCPAGQTRISGVDYYVNSSSECCQASSCTSTYGSWTYTTFSCPINNSLDTCNGDAGSSFTCGPNDSGKTCTDYIQTGSCTTSQGGSWTTLSDTYQFSTMQTRCSGTCSQTGINYICPSNIDVSNATPAVAVEACKAQCQGLTGAPGVPCSSSCQVVGNCWPNSNNVGVYCQVRGLSCTVTGGGSYSGGYRTVKCC
ncbi:MAG: hypothetical protein FWF35_01690 [Elusimicrobia bacterium]|nr:hypothetical protein [Elusimicrobiota bacterium]